MVVGNRAKCLVLRRSAAEVCGIYRKFTMSVPRLTVMDDIASRRALYLCGFITALFAVGPSSALLAGRPDAQRIAVPISTASIGAVPNPMPDNPPDVSAAEVNLPPQFAGTIGDLTEKGQPAPATAAEEREAPPSAGGDPMVPSQANNGLGPEPALSASSAHTPTSTKQRRARTSSMSKLYAPNKHHQIPSGAEKMFDANWQPKAFAYQ